VRLSATHQDVERLKDKLMLQRGVSVSKAEEIINKRKLTMKKKAAKPHEV
jgi:hypothetical protein